MDWQILVNIANVIVALGVIVAITQININRKQLHFGTIARCLEEFRKLQNIKSSDATEREIKMYVDLISEELFYFQHGYLPKEIALEWLDGMIDYMVLFDQNDNILNNGNCAPALQQRHEYFLKGYPRIKETFTIRQNFDMHIIYSDEKQHRELRSITRKQIAQEMYQNVINFSF